MGSPHHRRVYKIGGGPQNKRRGSGLFPLKRRRFQLRSQGSLQGHEGRENLRWATRKKNTASSPTPRIFPRLSGCRISPTKSRPTTFSGWRQNPVLHGRALCPIRRKCPSIFSLKTQRSTPKSSSPGEGADELFGGYPMYLEGGHFGDYERIPLALRKNSGGHRQKTPPL